MCRVLKHPETTANTLVLHLNCPTCIRRFGAAGSVMKRLTGPEKTPTWVIHLTVVPAGRMFPKSLHVTLLHEA